jgi:hypothetical protein
MLRAIMMRMGVVGLWLGVGWIELVGGNAFHL